MKKLNRWHLWLGLGVSLLVAGAVFLGIGLFSELRGGDSDAGPSPRTFRGVSTHLPGVDGPGHVFFGRSVSLRPRVVSHQMIIESLGVNAPVVEMGMDDENVPYVPLNAEDVAWYDFSPRPGDGGNTVFAAHINWGSTPGVFADLDDLQPGEIIRLISEDGVEYTYEVFDNFSVDPTDSDSLKVLAPTPTDTITLVSCAGTWVPDPDDERLGGSYTDRIIVKAERVDTPKRFRTHIGF